MSLIQSHWSSRRRRRRSIGQPSTKLTLSESKSPLCRKPRPINRESPLRFERTIRIEKPTRTSLSNPTDQSNARTWRFCRHTRFPSKPRSYLTTRPSPATDPRAGWRKTVREQRRDIQRLLKESPSLRPEVPGIIDEELSGAREEASASLWPITTSSPVLI